MRWPAWSCAVCLVCGLSGVPGAAADSFAHHVVAVTLAPKPEQAEDQSLADFYVDMGAENGALRGTQFWVYRVQAVGPAKEIAIPVGRLEAFQVEDRVSIARIAALTLPADNALVEYRTVLVGDAVEPIAGTGLPLLGERDLPAEVLTVRPDLLPPLAARDRTVRTFSIPNVVLFDFDKSTLRPEGKAILAQVAAFIKDTAARAVRIEGHTDAIGTQVYNQRLSQRRSAAVKRYLTRVQGIAAGVLTAVGYGETRPVASNGTPAGRQRNRRSEITVDGQPPVRAVLDGLAIGPEALRPEGEEPRPDPAGDAGTAAAPAPGAPPPAAPREAAEPPFPELARPPG